jgi:catechol 2,3-dioxygenase-like lactoylglutathione lyase family enzyme
MQILHVNVFVNDLPKATEFYRDKLGLHLQLPEHGCASFSAFSVRLGVALPEIGFEVPKAKYTRLSGLGVCFTIPPAKQP